MEANKNECLSRYITSAGGIPFQKVYGKLVFPKKEIDLWIDAQLNPERNQTLTGKVRGKINKNINIKKRIMENKENNQEITVVDTLIGILKKDAKHLTPVQLINYTELFEAASKVCQERDWVWAMFNIMFREVGRPPLYMSWEHLIINFLKEEARFTPEQINGYIALVKAASKAAPEDYWLKPILELMRRELGYNFGLNTSLHCNDIV